MWSDEAPWTTATKDSLSHADARGRTGAIGRRVRGESTSGEMRVQGVCLRTAAGTDTRLALQQPLCTEAGGAVQRRCGEKPLAMTIKEIAQMFQTRGTKSEHIRAVLSERPWGPQVTMTFVISSFLDMRNFEVADVLALHKVASQLTTT